MIIGQHGDWSESMLATRTAALFRAPVDAFQIPERARGRQVVTPRLVAQAHRHNVRVHVWTVDEIADMHRLLDWGVDGIMTDWPDILARVLGHN